MLMMRSDIRFLSDEEIIASYNTYKKGKNCNPSTDYKTETPFIEKKIAVNE